MKVKIRLTHPEYVICGDKIGTDIAQDDDRHIGGQTYLCDARTRAKIAGNSKTAQFTTIGLTEATGPVTCIIIFSGKELTPMQRV
eukprot:4813235-Ditylum_brightwellii.AAC.1